MTYVNLESMKYILCIRFFSCVSDEIITKTYNVLDIVNVKTTNKRVMSKILLLCYSDFSKRFVSESAKRRKRGRNLKSADAESL